MWCFVDLINLIIIGGVTVALSVAIVFFFFYPGLKTMIIIVVGKKYDKFDLKDKIENNKNCDKKIKKKNQEIKRRMTELKFLLLLKK